MRPSQAYEVTAFDTSQTGIRAVDVARAEPDFDVLRRLDSIVGESPGCVLVAQNANYERNILKRFSLTCPVMAEAGFLDTVPLAKYVLPGLRSYSLDPVREELRIPSRPNRHRALPDVEITADVFQELLSRLQSEFNLNALRSLLEIAGLKTRVPPPEQSSLF
jgi:DNA polymerase-3 subunit epsilon